jgi:hypothetical protein
MSPFNIREFFNNSDISLIPSDNGFQFAVLLNILIAPNIILDSLLFSFLILHIIEYFPYSTKWEIVDLGN